MRDAVRAYFMLVTVDPVAGMCYNIGGTYSCTVGAILEALVALCERKDEITIEIDPERLRPVDADLQVPNFAKFTAHTGWRPEIPTGSDS